MLFGNHNYFIFCDPQINPEENVDWETAMKEVYKDQLAAGGNDEEIKKKMKELED